MAQAWTGRAAIEPLEAAREHGYGLPDEGAPHGGGDEHGGHHSTPEPGVTRTVRTATYRGREIRIETTYKVTIDGQPLAGTLEVLDDGMVHYHGLPQYALPSAVEMLERVVDYFGFKPEVEDELGALTEEGPR
jgi:hypothetical protein